LDGVGRFHWGNPPGQTRQLPGGKWGREKCPTTTIGLDKRGVKGRRRKRGPGSKTKNQPQGELEKTAKPKAVGVGGSEQNDGHTAQMGVRTITGNQRVACKKRTAGPGK